MANITTAHVPTINTKNIITEIITDSVIAEKAAINPIRLSITGFLSMLNNKYRPSHCSCSPRHRL
jgi:hypothetical protein